MNIQIGQRWRSRLGLFEIVNLRDMRSLYVKGKIVQRFSEDCADLGTEVNLHDSDFVNYLQYLEGQDKPV